MLTAYQTLTDSPADPAACRSGSTRIDSTVGLTPGHCVEVRGPRMASLLAEGKTTEGVVLTERRRALEEAFFAWETEGLRQELRRRYKHRSEKKALMQAAGIFDEIVIEELLNLNISADTLTALQLIPLIEVAWADQDLDDQEREAIIGWARGEDRLDRPIQQLLETWLQRPPPKKVLEAWKDYVLAVYSILPPAVRDSWKRQVIDSMNKVARASGGVWGLRKASVEERTVIAEVEHEFEKQLFILRNLPHRKFA